MAKENFLSMKTDLAGVYRYLEKYGVKLSESEKSKLNTIFEACDTYDDEKKKAGKDSKLNLKEMHTFYNRLKAEMPNFQKYILELISNVKKQNIQTDVVKGNNQELSKKEVATKLYKKWSGVFKNSNLKEDFYEKLYDVIDIMNIDITNSSWNKKEYATKKEQVMDEMIAIFAAESQLNSKKQKGQYYGVFQLAARPLIDLKAWAKDNPDVYGMKNIDQNLKIANFKNVPGTKQLDYLIAYIGKSKEYSKIDKNASITPGQLWAMIKYPFKGKHLTTVRAKSDSIQSVFRNNNLPKGL